ncbi:alpha-mannosidase [Vigna unguiculata]|uniref:Alpha-mannosidase n=1 Tax=Vigna unguiculata TaxID=3917 RepID=A0A4D6M7N6_VIGUN|nr:alpha-mannosidase [Vigna unguiculata]
MVNAAAVFAFLVAAIWVVESEYIEYNTTQRIVPDKINVHLVPHSHDDVGWLKTVDQYYVGANNSIRGACVQNVLDSVISSLLEDKNRKFIYVEMAFFQRWWRQQSKAMKIKVKELVNSGQLEFINGGMCMHDEATPHYIDLIDQTTRGHQFIKEEFGKVPRVGWQIDPFGHSAVQAYLLGAELGFDSLFFARIDYQDRAKRLKEKTLEVIWQGCKSLGSSSQIFTGIFPRHYDPPDGFTFEINDVSPPIQDDILLFDYNVQERVNDFVYAALAQANVTKTNHIMWTMGTDFRYQYANSWFRQMDKFIHYVNQDGRVNALYSTPSIYTDAKYAANEYWPLKVGDFFPYKLSGCFYEAKLVPHLWRSYGSISSNTTDQTPTSYIITFQSLPLPMASTEGLQAYEEENLLLSLPKEKDWIAQHLYLFQDFWYPSNFIEGVINFQKHFQAKDSDVIVATVPKSGTTWLKALTFAILNRQRFSSSHNHPLLTSNSHELVPPLELIFHVDNIQDKLSDLSNITEPRVFGTHVPFPSLPKSIKESNCKIVYICRNPFDTIVSLWIFANKNNPLNELTIEETLEKYCKGIVGFGPTWEHMLGYWKESIANPNKVLFLKYEELKEDINFYVKRVAEFLDCPFTEEEESNGVIENIINLKL